MKGVCKYTLYVQRRTRQLRPQISTYLLRIRIKRGNKGKNKD